MIKYDQALHDRTCCCTLLQDAFVSFLSSWSVWTETKSFPALKLSALFCWKFSNCVWSSLLPCVGKRKEIPNCLFTFHTLILHLVLSPEYYFTEWIGWLLFNQLHHPLSIKLTSLSKGCKSKIQKRRQKLGPITGERCERKVLVFRSTERQKLLRSASHMK